MAIPYSEATSGAGALDAIRKTLTSKIAPALIPPSGRKICVYANFQNREEGEHGR